MLEARSVVMFGAGCVGRGFLGQLFFESGYALTVIEIDELLLAAFKARGAYTLRLVDGEHQEERTIGVTRALYSRIDASVLGALADTSLVTTAVGVRALPDIAPIVAAGIVQRAEQGVAAPLNVLICENMPEASATFGAMVRAHIPAAHRAYCDGHVGFVDVVVGRTIPRPTAEMRARDVGFILTEPYNELPVNRPRFVGPLPPVMGLQPVDNFQAYIERKLYLHNCGHAILGYLGYARGHTFDYQALTDPEIYRVLAGAFEEAKLGLCAAHGFAEADLDGHIASLVRRFNNRALTDTVSRLARDPLRKLGPQERLVGAARRAEQAGVVPRHLSLGIAAAYRYDAADDPLAVALQARIAAEGLEVVMQAVSAIEPDSPLGRLVREQVAQQSTQRFL